MLRGEKRLYDNLQIGLCGGKKREKGSHKRTVGRLQRKRGNSMEMKRQLSGNKMVPSQGND